MSRDTVVLWCAIHTSKIRELIARPNLNDRSALDVFTGETPDITEFMDFDFYQFVIYYDPNDDDGMGRRKLARWLGPVVVSVGQGLCFTILLKLIGGTLRCPQCDRRSRQTTTPGTRLLKMK
jgi:hypothetical protein